MKQVLATVILNKEVMPGVYLIWLESPHIASVAKPGQFVMVCCGEDTLLRRPFSIHQVNDDKTNIALLFQLVGRGTNWLAHCQLGDELDVLGPLGNGYSINPASRNLLLVGGGIGIAPLIFLAWTAYENKCNITMLAGINSTPYDGIENSLPPNTNLIYTSENGLIGIKGLVTIVIPDYFECADQIFACGPSPMYRAMAQMPQLKGKPVQISLEVRMGCGFGLCYGCAVKTKTGLKQICKDGPVFELDEIMWDEFADI